MQTKSVDRTLLKRRLILVRLTNHLPVFSSQVKFYLVDASGFQNCTLPGLFLVNFKIYLQGHKMITRKDRVHFDPGLGWS